VATKRHARERARCCAGVVGLTTANLSPFALLTLCVTPAGVASVLPPLQTTIRSHWCVHASSVTADTAVATSTAAIDVDMLGVAGLPGARPSFLLSLRLAVAPAGEGLVLSAVAGFGLPSLVGLAGLAFAVGSDGNCWQGSLSLWASHSVLFPFLAIQALVRSLETSSTQELSQPVRCMKLSTVCVQSVFLLPPFMHA
jgi:hypothetical protein